VWRCPRPTRMEAPPPAPSPLQRSSGGFGVDHAVRGAASPPPRGPALRSGPLPALFPAPWPGHRLGPAGPGDSLGPCCRWMRIWVTLGPLASLSCGPLKAIWGPGLLVWSLWVGSSSESPTRRNRTVDGWQWLPGARCRRWAESGRTSGRIAGSVVEQALAADGTAGGWFFAL